MFTLKLKIFISIYSANCNGYKKIILENKQVNIIYIRQNADIELKFLRLTKENLNICQIKYFTQKENEEEKSEVMHKGGKGESIDYLEINLEKEEIIKLR